MPTFEAFADNLDKFVSGVCGREMARAGVIHSKPEEYDAKVLEARKALVDFLGSIPDEE